MIATYGRLLGPEEMREAVKVDVNAFGPGVQFRYQRDLEPPDVSEGFSRVDVVPFERHRDQMIQRPDALEIGLAPGGFGRRPVGLLRRGWV